MPIKNKILKQLSSVLLTRDTGAGGGSTTLTAAAAKGATSLTVAGIANFASGDTIRVGSGEELELAVINGAPAGAVITLADPLSYDHIIGEGVVEQIAYDLGDVAEEGAGVTISGGSTDIPVATKRLSFTTINGFLDMAATFGLPTLTMDMLAFVLGIPFTDVSGTGVSTDPYSLITDGNSFDSVVDASLIIIGTRMDGTTTRIELWGVNMDYTGLSLRLSRGASVSLPARAVASAGGVMTDNASAYVKNATRKPTKGSAFSHLEEVGFFKDKSGGVSTTSAGTNAAGQKVLNVTAAGATATGMWLRIGDGDTVEYHRVASVSVNAITLDDKLFRAIAAGTAVVQQDLIPWAGVSEEGVTLAFGGSVDAIRSATRRLSVGIKAGDARVTVSFGVMDISLSNFAYALGIPQALIVGGRLPLGNDIGTSEILGLYVRGVTKDGKKLWINCWGCSQDINNIAATFASRGIANVPLSVRPASAVQFLQHA